MKIEYDNFIGRYSEVYSPGFCQHLIAEFERLAVLGVGSDRIGQSPRHNKDDYQVDLAVPSNFSKPGINFSYYVLQHFEDVKPLEIFMNGLQACFEEYIEKYSVLKPPRLRGSSVKAQKTDPGQGYHIWHHEQGDTIETSSRGLVYSLYLNSLDEKAGGETEFLYYKERIPAVENTLIIWPAGFTHAHRGNMVLGEKSKYIITGWFNYDV